MLLSRIESLIVFRHYDRPRSHHLYLRQQSKYLLVSSMHLIRRVQKADIATYSRRVQQSHRLHPSRSCTSNPSPIPSDARFSRMILAAFFSDSAK